MVTSDDRSSFPSLQLPSRKEASINSSTQQSQIDQKENKKGINLGIAGALNHSANTRLPERV